MARVKIRVKIRDRVGARARVGGAARTWAARDAGWGRAAAADRTTCLGTAIPNEKVSQ